MVTLSIVVGVFLTVNFCFVNSEVPIEDGYQSWVVDPRNSIFPTLPIVAPNSEDELCRKHSRLFLEGLENKTLWAMQMWDSSMKAPFGVLSGEIFHFGNFDECLKISAPLKVQYCLGHLFANVSLIYYALPGRDVLSTSSVWNYVAKSRINPSKVPRDVIGWGLCVPATCKPKEIEKTINLHLSSFSKKYNNESNFVVTINDDFCTQKSESMYFSPGEIAFWVFLFSLILLTTTSTLINFTSDRKENQPSKLYNLWMLFSIKQNYSHLIPMETRTKNSLDVFHGIKFVSILFIIYGHRVGISLSLSAINYDDIEDYYIKEHKMFFVHSDLIVDTFFFISGLLACYIMMGIYSKKFVNPLYTVAVRIFRLAPLYFFVIWYQGTAAFRLGSGPLWNPLATNETAYCVQHWWTNVLFISNYIKTEEMCLPHSWFLPCEIHFFTMTAILVSIIVKYPKFGRILLGIITTVFIIVPAVVIYVHKASPLILFYYDFLAQPRKNWSFNLLYVKSHNRAAVYLIGMIVGLFLHHTKDVKKQISKKLALCGVLGWFAFMFAPMAYGSLYYDLDKKYHVIEAAIFGSLRRVSWAIAFTIFILSHRFGNIPFVDLLFSTKLSVFLSRITYGMYLVHFCFITSDVLTNRTPRTFSIHNVIIEGIGDIFKAASVTLVLIFIIEIPLKRLFKEILFVKKIKDLERPPPISNVFTVRL